MLVLLAASRDERSWVERLPGWPYLLVESLFIISLLSELMVSGVLRRVARPRHSAAEVSTSQFFWYVFRVLLHDHRFDWI